MRKIYFEPQVLLQELLLNSGYHKMELAEKLGVEIAQLNAVLDIKLNRNLQNVFDESLECEFKK